MTDAEIQQNPMAQPLNQFGSTILIMTNPEDELYKLELIYRSTKQSPDNTLIQIGEPLMNEYGINAVIGMIQAQVNKVTIMSNLNKDEIPVLIDFLGDTLARDLMINRIAYGIKSKSARDKIYFSALSMAYLTLKRCYEEGDKRFWKSSVQEIEQRVINNNSKQGLLSSINPFK